MICSDCVSPNSIKKQIFAHSENGKCKYCKTSKQCAKVSVVFDYIIARIDENLAIDKDLSSYEEYMVYEGGSDDINVASLDVVAYEWIGFSNDDDINAEICDDFLEYVPQSYVKNDTGHDVLYFEDGGLLERNIFEDEWTEFIEEVTHAHRFFNPIAQNFLDSVFSFITMADGVIKPECLTEVKSGEMLYRARKVKKYNDAELVQSDPASQFGPPPKLMAGSQRMTPTGISAMYCGFDRSTCLSEIRSITGDIVVSIAITPRTSMKFLDLRNLARLKGSDLTWLDEGFLSSCHLKSFISSLVNKMSKPKGQNDELSYLSTQVVFEYLRLKFHDRIEGLIFPSVQTGARGSNAVIFPEYCLLSGTKYDADEMGFFDQAAIADNASGDPAACLMHVAHSTIFHKITAIETTSTDYENIHEAFMDDLTRQRLGVK